MFAIYSSPSLFFAVETRVPLVFAFRPKVGPVPAENLREILHHEIGFRDAGSPDPNSNCENCFFNQNFCQDVCCFDIFLPGILDSAAFFSLFSCCVLYICFFRVWTPWFLHFLFFLSASQQVRVGARSARGE